MKLCPQQIKQDAWDEKVAAWTQEVEYERKRQRTHKANEHYARQRLVWGFGRRYDSQGYCDNPARGY